MKTAMLTAVHSQCLFLQHCFWISEAKVLLTFLHYVRWLITKNTIRIEKALSRM